MSGRSAQKQEIVRIELLRPHEIRDALRKRSVVYVPLGTLEWHGEHLPIGLDALTAHSLCLQAAAQDGGLVLPPLYYGTGGDHGAYPWTIMMQGGGEIAAMLQHTISRLGDLEVSTVVLFSGHFAGSQVELVKRLAAEWNESSRSPRVLGLAVNGIEGLALGPDHAAIFETTLLAALHPDRVDISRLPAMTGGPLPAEDSWSPARHDPTHPLYGIIGPDPRVFDPAAAPQLVRPAVDWIVSQVRRIETDRVVKEP